MGDGVAVYIKVSSREITLNLMLTYSMGGARIFDTVSRSLARTFVALDYETLDIGGEHDYTGYHRQNIDRRQCRAREE